MIKQNVGVYTGKDEYELDNHVIMTDYSNRILEHLSLIGEINKMDVLDLGLGHGFTGKQFMNKFRTYTILEADNRIINYFKEKNTNIDANIIETYFEEFNTNQKYDAIIMGFVLEHVERPLDVLKKYKEYIKPDGRLFITVPNALSLNRRVGKEMGVLDDVYKLSKHDIESGHKWYFDVEKISDICNDAGFNINRIEGLYLKPLTSSQMRMGGVPIEAYRALSKLGKDYPELSVAIFLECRDMN